MKTKYSIINGGLKDIKVELTGCDVRHKGGRGRKIQAKGTACINVESQSDKTHLKWDWVCTLRCRRIVPSHSIKWL